LQIDIETGAAVLTVMSRKYGRFDVLIDPEDWERICEHSWWVHHGKNNYVYFATQVRQADGKWKTLKLHRFLMGSPAGLEVDHIHHNYLDLRKSELRITTHKQNGRNQRKQNTPASSCFKGVSWHKLRGKWSASIKHNGKSIYLGLFPATPSGEIAAARSYDRKALELFGAYALLNFPIDQLQKLAA
jgi:hypothetical protein